MIAVIERELADQIVENRLIPCGMVVTEGPPKHEHQDEAKPE
jgi:hypothetical protein